MRGYWALAAGGVLVCLLSATAGAQTSKPATLKNYDSRYYTLHTDLDNDTVREAIARITAMAEMYNARTKGFAGAIRGKMPFVMFSKKDDYYAAGGPEGSAGVYMGSSLMAMATPPIGANTWQVVQHEGFHQFARLVITPRLPVSINEGLAEYFGLGIWTGDGFVTGVIPPSRLKRLRGYIDDDKLIDVDKMIALTHDNWQLQSLHYDESWAIIQFLGTADDSKYAPAFNTFINDVAAGKDPKAAFAARYGNDIAGLQSRFKGWILGLDANPTRELYVQAVVATMTSYLARSTYCHQTFKDAGAFFAACKDGKLGIDDKRWPSLWLPPSLLEDNLDVAGRLEDWSLDSAAKLPKLKLTETDGMEFVGSFTLTSSGIGAVTVTTTKPKAKPATATSRPMKK